MARRHRPALDGVRGLAVAAVVAYHLGYLRGGYLGVDVFFVLSGYLITGLVLVEVEQRGQINVRAFWGRRIRRLVPAVLVMVTAVVAVALALGWPEAERRALAIDATATLTWWANWRQAGGASYWASGESLFRHAWSLSIEEQFYLAWPLVILALAVAARRRTWPLSTVLGIAAAVGAASSAAWLTVLSHRLGDADLSRAYVGTDTRVLAPLAGCALACWMARRDRSRDRRAVQVVGGLVGTAILVAMMVVVDVSDPAMYRQGGFIVAALAACLVVRSIAEVDDRAREPVAWLTTRPLTRYLGTRSYGLYLWSWPVQVLIVFRWPEVPGVALAAATIVLSLALAEASGRLVEEPLRRNVGWAAPVRARRPAWAAGALGAVAVVWASVASAAPPPAHERIDTNASAAAALRPAETTTTTTTTTTTAMDDPPASVPDQPAADLRVMVTGDSVAWTVGYYKPSVADFPPGIASVDSRAIIGCGLLAAEGWSFQQGGAGGPFAPAAEACIEQPEAERLGLEGSPDVVVLFPGAWEWGDVRAPDGEVFAARSPELAAVLKDRMMRRIVAAQDVGARFVLVEWSCPGSTVADVRADPAFTRWINQVMADVAAQAIAEYGATVEVLAPTAEVCVDANPVGLPTPAKIEATGDEVHVVSKAGGRWIWHSWLGPGLVAR